VSVVRFAYVSWRVRGFFPGSHVASLCRSLPITAGDTPATTPKRRARDVARPRPCGIAWRRVPDSPNPRLIRPETNVSASPDRQATWGSPISKRFPRPLGIKTAATGLWLWVPCSGFPVFRPLHRADKTGCWSFCRPSILGRVGYVEHRLHSACRIEYTAKAGKPHSRTPTVVITCKTPGLPGSRDMFLAHRMNTVLHCDGYAHGLYPASTT
jgi:hypothetical protein